MNAKAPPPSEPTEPPQPQTRPLWKRFPAPVWIIFAGMFINRFGTFVLPFLALHMTKLGYSLKEAGVAMAAYGAGHLVASVIGGHLADSIGRRNTIVLSMAGAAVSMLLLSCADSFAAFVVLAALTGVAAEFYKPASSALLADLTDPEDRVLAFAAFRLAINAGWAVGPATAGLLASHSYQWLFWGDAATSVLFGAIAYLGLPNTMADESADVQRPAWRHPIRELVFAFRAGFGHRAYRWFLVSSLAIAVVFMQMTTTFGLEVKSSGLNERAYGMLLALNGILIVIFEMPIAAITRKRDARSTIAQGYVLMAAGFGSLAFSNTAIQYATSMAVFTLGEMVSMPVAMAYAAHLAPPRMRGRFMGLQSLTWSVALLIGPALGMAVFGRSPVLWWLFCAVLGFFAAALLRLGPDGARDAGTHTVAAKCTSRVPTGPIAVPDP